MCVCVYVYICMCMYIYVCVCICICIYIYECSYVSEFQIFYICLKDMINWFNFHSVVVLLEMLVVQQTES